MYLPMLIDDFATLMSKKTRPHVHRHVYVLIAASCACGPGLCENAVQGQLFSWRYLSQHRRGALS
jgi:hypothetical protein